MIVLDTNVISELMRATPAPAVVQWLRAQQPLDVFTTSVSVAEVRYGIARLPRGKRKSQLTKDADELFTAFADQVLAFDNVAANDYASVLVERAGKGRPISGFDAQIAAICRSRAATLATRNTSDFAGLDLEIVNPWAA